MKLETSNMKEYRKTRTLKIYPYRDTHHGKTVSVALSRRFNPQHLRITRITNDVTDDVTDDVISAVIYDITDYIIYTVTRNR